MISKRKSVKSPLKTNIFHRSMNSNKSMAFIPTQTTQISDEEIFMNRRISRIYDIKMSVILEKAIDVLLKPSGLRTLEEIYHLIRATEKLEFFSKMRKSKEQEIFQPSSLLFKCCKALRYEAVGKGHTVFDYGDKGEKFYIIIKGTVCVLLPKEHEAIQEEKERLFRLRRNREVPDYFKSLLAPSSTLSPNASPVILPHCRPLKSMEKLQKGISKISTALKFLKKVEISSETTRSEVLPQKKKITKKSILADLEQENHLFDFQDGKKDSLFSFSPQKKKEFFIDPNFTGIPGMDIKDLYEKDEYFDDGVFKYYVVSTLTSGNVFGELALIRKKKRSARIVCTENSHFAVLMRKDYENILQQLYTDKYERLFDFFQKTIFQRLSRDRLTKIAYLYVKRKFVKEQIVFCENDEPTECYIIKNGDVELSKKIKKKNKIKGEGKEEKKEGVNKKELACVREGFNKMEIKVSIVSIGQWFGEEHIIKKKKRSYTAKVISNKASLFVISKQNFEKILEENSNLLKDFKLSITNKEKWHKGKVLHIEQVLSNKDLYLPPSIHLKLKKTPKIANHNTASTRLSVEELDNFLLIPPPSSSGILNTSSNEQNSDIHTSAYYLKSNGGVVLKGRKKNNCISDLRKDYMKITKTFSNLVKMNKNTMKLMNSPKVDLISLYNQTKSIMKGEYNEKFEKARLLKVQNTKNKNLDVEKIFGTNTENYFKNKMNSFKLSLHQHNDYDFLNFCSPKTLVTDESQTSYRHYGSLTPKTSNIVKTHNIFKFDLKPQIPDVNSFLNQTNKAT